MRRCGSILLLLLLLVPVFGERIGTIEEVMKPQMIKVQDDELFVVEGHQIFIYSLPRLTLKKRIGKDGEGPGEFKLDPARTIIFTVHPDFILAESRNKIVYFDRRGDFLREKRKTPGILQTIPLGKNYALLGIVYEPEGRNYFTVSIMDPEFNAIKEIYRQKFFSFKGKTHVIPDGLNLCVVDDKLYVEESPDGFVIEVYDSSGKKLKRIEKEFSKIPVTTGDKQIAFEDLLKIPALRRAIHQQGRNQVINDLKPNLVYPEFFPPIRYLTAARERLYVKTAVRKNGRDEFLVLDLNGRELNRLYFPAAKKVDFLVQMQGDKNYFTIHDDKYYYLKYVETEDDESWEVHVEKLAN